MRDQLPTDSRSVLGNLAIYMAYAIMSSGHLPLMMPMLLLTFLAEGLVTTHTHWKLWGQGSKRTNGELRFQDPRTDKTGEDATWPRHRDCPQISRQTLIFLSLLFWTKQGKPPKKARILSLCRTPKIPWKEGKNAQKSKEIPCNEKTRKSKKARKGRSGQKRVRGSAIQELPSKPALTSLISGSKPF